MPRVLVYRDARDRVPLLDWLDGLDRECRAACVVKVEMLGRLGHGLRRPHADVLRNGIHELRARRGALRLRMLYFFHGHDVVVLTHGFTKHGAKVPDIEIDRALRSRERFVAEPLRHIHPEGIR